MGTTHPKYDTLIVGGGLAGLACARYLTEHGYQVLVLEASDGVGGKLRTDVVDGFLLDRGFQVYLTEYPMGKRLLNVPALKGHRFQKGALVRVHGKFHKVPDPWDNPWLGFLSLMAPIGSLKDKLQLAKMRADLCSNSLAAIEARWSRGESGGTTEALLKQYGFSDTVMERFLSPFFGGVFLHRPLDTPALWFQYIFKVFAEGQTILPDGGMQAIPENLMQKLPEGSVRLNAQVESIAPGAVSLKSGETLYGQTVVVATDAMDAHRLMGLETNHHYHGVTCLYYSADQSPVDEPILVLNGEGKGLINNLCVPSMVNPRYAPPDKHLISVSVLGIPNRPLDKLERDVRQELVTWYGPVANSWNHLRTYSIRNALPRKFMASVGSSYPGTMPEHDTFLPMPDLPPGMFLAGDYCVSPSIQGALQSGVHAAMAVASKLDALVTR